MITPLEPTGVQLRRAILLRRYENTLDALVQRRLEQVRQRLIDLLTRQDLTAVSPGRAAARLESLARQADAILLQAYQDLNALTRENLVELASVQSRAAAGYLAQRVGTVIGELGLPTRALLRSIVTTDPIRGAVLWDWWQRQRIATRNAFRTQLQIGLTQGESLGDLIIRIRGRSVGGGRFVGGVMRTTTREAAALVRTSVNHIANTAALETYKANDDITESYEWVSTLDDRTCFVPGTELLTPTGLRPIEEIGIGETVIGGSGQPRRVLATRKASTRWVAIVRLSNGIALRCTPDHLFLSTDGKWVEAKDLRPGSVLAEPPGGV